MPKAKKRPKSPGVFDFLYDDVAQMPWAEIERAVGISFCGSDRQEIFECTEAFSRTFGRATSAASIGEISKLRESLLEHARGLVEIHDRCFSNPRHRRKPGDSTRDALQALDWTRAFGSPSLRDLLREPVEPLVKIIEAIEAGDRLGDLETTSSEPENEALLSFIAAVMRGAKEVPARGKVRDSRSKPPSEYQRWGIAVGPTTKQFRAFASAVLRREISQDRMKHVFEKHNAERMNQPTG